jgi:hypothetical protein
MDANPSPSRSGRRRRWVVGALLPLVLVGCDALAPTSRDGGLTKAQFVDVIVALREAEREIIQDVTSDSAHVAFAERRDEILQRHGVSEEDLRQFVARHRDRPALVTDAWDQIAQRLGVRTEDIMDGLPGMEALPYQGELPRVDELPRVEEAPPAEGPRRLEEPRRENDRATGDRVNPV